MDTFSMAVGATSVIRPGGGGITQKRVISEGRGLVTT